MPGFCAGRQCEKSDTQTVYVSRRATGASSEGPAGLDSRNLEGCQPFRERPRDGVTRLGVEPFHRDAVSRWSRHRRLVFRGTLEDLEEPRARVSAVANGQCSRVNLSDEVLELLCHRTRSRASSRSDCRQFSTVNADKSRRLFEDLHVWKRQEKRAPHKPLLALWAIGRCINRKERLASFRLIDTALSRLLHEFGPPASWKTTHYPFWRLQNDDVWQVQSTTKIRQTRAKDPFKSDLLKGDAKGGFPEDLFSLLLDHPSLAEEIACSLVRAHFPVTLQAEVLRAVGIERTSLVERVQLQRIRASSFRKEVLTAYNFQCAVCGFAIRFGSDLPVALDAAHIKWHQALGPAIVRNGLSLCSLHHRLFDYGAFTLARDLKVMVSDSAEGTGAWRWLRRFNGRHLIAIPDQELHPDPYYIEWHRDNVFRSM